MTPNDEVNALAALHFAPLFGRNNVYQLPPSVGEQRREEQVSPELQGRPLFAPHATYDLLNDRLNGGAQIKRTPITKEFTFEHFKQTYGQDAVPLLLVSESREVTVITAARPPAARPGQTLISLVHAAVPVPPPAGQPEPSPVQPHDLMAPR
jgi:hypothetical protein